MSLAILLSCGAAAAQPPTGEAAYVLRGKQTEARLRAYHDRMDRLRAELVDALRVGALDLIRRLEPAPASVFGYGILPRIASDDAPPPPPKPQVVRYSWPWSDTLIAGEMHALDRIENELQRVSSGQGSVGQETYETLVTDYKKAVENRRPIDADIDYNWLWQRRIAERRPLYDRLQAQLDLEVQRLAQPDWAARPRTERASGFDPSAFVRIEHPSPHDHLVRVPILTDITDVDVVRAFVSAVESYWHVRSGEDEYRVRLSVTTFLPKDLYCSNSPLAPNRSEATCAQPAAGEHIDLVTHAARFPPDGAVLTTGAAALQLVGARALVLSPHSVAPRTLAHEFGHLLGFPDAYLRGYKDIGADGFQVLELVPDHADIMSSPGSGSVQARHFEGLIVAKAVHTAMQAGLDALYQRLDAAEAVMQFRKVLAMNAEHFGATLQLAKALDQTGRSDEAIVVWQRVLTLADAVQNGETSAMARQRLARRP